MKSNDERIERLEEQNYFLERRVQELDSVLTFQQEQIDRLEKQLKESGQALETMRGVLESLAGKSANPALDVPPHWGKW